MNLTALRDQCRAAVRKTHGHVNRSPVVARCGGPAMCRHCLLELITPMVERETDDGQTHAEGCWRWGRRHYECAVARIEALEGPAEDSTFDDLPGLAKAFRTPMFGNRVLRPDYVIIDRSSPRWQVNEIDKAVERGLIVGKTVEIDEQETQCRFYLTDKGKAALSQA